MRDADLAQRVERVALDPQVGVGQPDAAPPGVAEPLDALLDPAAADRDDADSPRAHPLPARVADLASQREGVLVAGQRRVEIPARDVDVPAQRLGPRRERGPALASGELERLVERRRGGVELAGEELHAAEHRQRVRQTTPVTRARAQVARLGQLSAARA